MISVMRLLKLLFPLNLNPNYTDYEFHELEKCNQIVTRLGTHYNFLVTAF